MQLNIGSKIRELRHRHDRTQENLADALGITAQAVSRWESGGSYPDMEIIPSIANYFDVTIDELFGYEDNRKTKIDSIIKRIDSFNIKSRSDDKWIEDCLLILREGIAEFPNNERLMFTLADTLTEAGWRRHKEWLCYDEEGFIHHNYEIHQNNEFWAEAIKISEHLADNANDNEIVTKSLRILVLLYRNIGENEKAVACANKMPELKNCREVLLASASDGKEDARYIGEFLLKSAREFTGQLIYGLMTNKHNFDSDMPIDKIKGAIALFYLICDDGNLGIYHSDLVELYLYLSRVEWERGYHDEAFVSLDKALEHSKALESLSGKTEHNLTAPLVSFVKCSIKDNENITKSLPDVWPMWCCPDYSETEKEIKADPRWQRWVERTREKDIR